MPVRREAFGVLISRTQRTRRKKRTDLSRPNPTTRVLFFSLFLLTSIPVGLGRSPFLLVTLVPGRDACSAPVGRVPDSGRRDHAYRPRREPQVFTSRRPLWARYKRCLADGCGQSLAAWSSALGKTNVIHRSKQPIFILFTTVPLLVTC